MNFDEKIYKNYISTHFGSFHDFDKEIGTIYRLFKKNYLRYLPFDKNIRILDLGCGMGHLLYFLEMEGYKNYFGIDLSAENVKFCKRRNFNVLQSDVFDFLRSNKEKTDMIFLNDLLEHFNIEKAIILLELIRENLKTGGKVIIKTPNAASPILGSTSMYQDITHKFCFTQISLAQILKVSGFNKIEIFPQDIYIFTYNPINYAAKMVAFLLNQIFWLIFMLYGKKTITIFDKHLIAVAEK